ncbi:helix-turn-helix domain-containing protein [Aliiroseovarius sp. 2305UL8-7]|uniref:helix-turn-helix domain-containing protein n=1 Tax=Aliiroseovarius conchicola TaxID=3121637 RepID=UPI0035292192
MLFVPLPLFATLFLVLLLCRIVLTRDMKLRAHQLFAGLVALYAVQSLLVTLRWGYEIEGVAPYLILLAPVLPAVAYFSYAALAGRQTGRKLWPLVVVAMNWVAFAALPFIPDPLILMTYLGFGMLLLGLWWKGTDALSLSPINDTREIRFAMCLTGMALVASGLTDIFLIFDFIRNEGRNAGLVLTFVQTVFILAIGLAASFGRAATVSEPEEVNVPARPAPSEHDSDIVGRIEGLFKKEGLHRDEDLSLRRLARRLSLPDRQVSNAINRVRHMSVSQFVNDFRIQEACVLLNETDKSVLEISLTAGFATKSNFNREFSRVTGCTPTRWRKEHRLEGT